ncbi:DUF3775 domain-containing protein [Limnoglobus roseus]|uniref:Uncharacterized protein n=1 Tax=Limnoglobus roseus TaxID=2598579 RepID=A0A5C1AL22_9BACT|nr:DUF3775 domain-containing protein [Limnoglobus roseus]QEL19325.1 hypothetical protein PX52LOC_06393 [Limnoglobus roseus]
MIDDNLLEKCRNIVRATVSNAVYAVAALTDDELIQVTALAWLGREFSKEWGEAASKMYEKLLLEARAKHDHASIEYLVAKNNVLQAYIGRGLDLLGLDVFDYDKAMRIAQEKSAFSKPPTEGAYQ